MSACIFCSIANHELESEILYQDDRCVAFRDIDPKAPVHILVIPTRHIEGLDAVSARDVNLLGHLCATAARLARDEGIAASGYRLVINCGPHGGQAVGHLHVHLLGGRQMSWPPG
ncbi:MAG: histidine triad nucleotide-binding protein [Armatimonadota bacterium]